LKRGKVDSMKPVLVRLFVKRQNGVSHVGFVRAQRFYPVEGLPGVSEGVEALVKEVSPGWSGEYTVTLDGATVTCRHSFYI
jgi:hypothetical protein